jgi:hypothetical protein
MTLFYQEYPADSTAALENGAADDVNFHFPPGDKCGKINFVCNNVISTPEGLEQL